MANTFLLLLLFFFAPRAYVGKVFHRGSNFIRAFHLFLVLNRITVSRLQKKGEKKEKWSGIREKCNGLEKDRERVIVANVMVWRSPVVCLALYADWAALFFSMKKKREKRLTRKERQDGLNVFLLIGPVTNGPCYVVIDFSGSPGR